MKMVLEDPKSYFEDKKEKLHYVGFMKSPQQWIPLCYASDPEQKQHLDTLLIADSITTMQDVVKSFAERIPEVEETFVQYLLPEEILNLVDRYALDHIAYLLTEEDPFGSCGCGCGCN